MDQHQRFLEFLAGGRWRVVMVEDAMARHQAAAADAKFRVIFLSERAFDELHARPHAAGILPAAAGAAEPLAEQRAGQHNPAFLLFERAGERVRLAGGPHASADERG